MSGWRHGIVGKSSLRLPGVCFILGVVCPHGWFAVRVGDVASGWLDRLSGWRHDIASASSCRWPKVRMVTFFGDVVSLRQGGLDDAPG